MNPRIYLDNNASTMLDPRVVQAIHKELEIVQGNPSSIHSFGQEVRNRVTKARRIISSFLNVKPQEIIFTSGGTEGMNMFLQGYRDQKPGHIISSNVEHSCVYNTLKLMQSLGWEITFLEAGLEGAPTVEQVDKAIRGNTRFITLMAVNNETGIKTDINAIAELAQERKIPFFIDGVALLGKESFRIPQGVSGMAFSGHKIHAPKGIGFVFMKSNLKIVPLLLGGGQEHNKRGGTENLLGIVGLAEAVSLLNDELSAATSHMKGLRDKLESKLIQNLPNVVVNGTGPRISNTTNLSFPGLDGESLLMSLDLEGIAVSHGSACSSGALEPSRILLNMGVPLEVAATSLRISVSRFTTLAEIDRAVDVIISLVTRLRALTNGKPKLDFSFPSSAD